MSAHAFGGSAEPEQSRNSRNSLREFAALRVAAVGSLLAFWRL